jgi:hypothetical protein
LRAPLDVTALERCLRMVAGRHAALRTGLVRRGDELLQRIEPEPSIALRVIDLVDRPAEQALVEAHAAARDDLRRPFDLERPRFHAVLARLAPQDSVLVVSVLHSMFDDFSHQLLVGELRALYARTMGGPQPRELPAPVPFSRFSEWQLDWQRDDRLRGQYEYWSRKLDGYSAAIDLPVLRPRSQVELDTRSNLWVSVAPARWKTALAIARAERVTPFALIVATLSAALAEHTGQDEVAIATVYGNRRQPWMQSVMGLLANTLVVRTSVAQNPSLRALLKRVAGDWLEALASGEFPFDELARRMGRTRLPGRGDAPAYEVLVNFHVAAAPSEDDRLSQMESWCPPEDDRPAGWSGCLLCITLRVTPDGALDARFRYTSELLSAEVVTAIATQFQTLVAALPDLLELPAARLGSTRSVEPHDGSSIETC